MLKKFYTDEQIYLLSRIFCSYYDDRALKENNLK